MEVQLQSDLDFGSENKEEAPFKYKRKSTLGLRAPDHWFLRSIRAQDREVPVKRKGSSLGLNLWDLVSLCEDAWHSQESNR